MILDIAYEMRDNPRSVVEGRLKLQQGHQWRLNMSDFYP